MYEAEYFRKPPGLTFLQYVRLDLQSDNGRLVEELTASDVAIAKNKAPMLHVRCPYPDSRAGTTINQSALEDIRQPQNWQGMIDGLAWMHHQYRNMIQTNILNNADLLKLTVATRSLASYLVNRVEDSSPSDAVPTVPANMVKAARGLTSILLRPDLKTNLADQSTSSVYELANRTGLLTMSEARRGCAASSSMITTAAEALFSGQHGHPEASELAQLVPNFRQLALFGQVYFSSELELRKYKYDQDEIIGSGLARPKSSGEVDAVVQRAVLMEKNHLLEMGACQDNFNGLLGRDVDNAPRPGNSTIREIFLVCIQDNVPQLQKYGRSRIQR